jgi:tricorn protease
MVGELSALHINVRNGDHREGTGQVENAFLGARLSPDREAGGYRVEHIFQADPDLPETLSPLARRGIEVREGDVILAINGTPVLEVIQPGILLRNQAGKQVHLTVRGQAGGETRQVIVVPMNGDQFDDLKYTDWEIRRRMYVEEKGGGQIGYVHLRAMGGGNYTEWARGYFPVFNRKGLVIDVRNNRGGNIDSWILADLLRRRWMYWQGRTGEPYPNMQYAFGGHLVVLVNERTASDGEAFAEGFRRLGLGKIIGTRTWGGEIWLTGSNLLVDGGIASAAEFGVYGPEGEWLIEGWGVEPDIVVDNLPHATFNGGDTQLDAAIAHLEKLIAEKPPAVPPPPPYPDKSFQPGGR